MSVYCRNEVFFEDEEDFFILDFGAEDIFSFGLGSGDGFGAFLTVICSVTEVTVLSDGGASRLTSGCDVSTDDEIIVKDDVSCVLSSVSAILYYM